jgi:hypothetical protein
VCSAKADRFVSSRLAVARRRRARPTSCAREGARR